ncbi:uncharacterized protein MYCFIDRAFT_86918 [Pseudocercospora fijiensis CIRAD86]|uniref:Vacuolar membrane PQ loop repeat protein n=1 Tax=Pseudocercospora fijiensis (strain CIRAD86) TaxID=383855 RepID=M3A7D5_PSEFD|nr:uncharacterized protein MYCFIDRAFT_86918 [Pseudocercospora fijiensis CIRAD86]EME80531.1 hypothetical protein MYCFIDRAFT_86918 [Pseudocercospora fijiensis CIRAD86]
MPPIHLTWNEALSGVFGSISLAAWIFLLVPQLIENYTNGHADGISLTFLFIWFIGDITNFAGAIWAGLVPTVIALAVYFCIADLVLISQCLYYLGLKKKQETEVVAREEGTEQTPLLNGHATQNPSNLGLPGSRRTSRASLRRTSTNEGRDSLERIMEEPTRTRAIVKNTVSFLGVCAVGAAGWAIAWKTGAWRPTPVGEEGDGGETPIGAEILGYISAVCYLGARIPQIIKNQRERSCDGLSLLFFMLSLLGNLTYGAGILFHSLERQYVITNTPWLIGSLGTIVEDAIIFIQFHAFGERAESMAVV